MPLFPLPEWVCRGAQWDQSMPSPHCPPITITVEGSGAGRGQRVPRSPFHPGTSGPFPPFVTQFGSIIPALAPGHVLGSKVMDSAAGEISPVGRGVGGLLARFHGVGRARGFLSQHPSRHPVQGPLPAGLPFSLAPCLGAKGPLLVPTAPTSPQKPGSTLESKGAMLGCK